MRKAALAILGVLMVAGAATAEQSRGFNVRDLVTLDRISDPQASPDGQQIVFVRRQTDLAADRGRTDLWLVGIDGQGLRRLTRHEASDSSPRWAPGGEEIFFLSTRSDGSQVWSIAADGGEAKQVTDLAESVGNFVLSPDGESVALTLEVFPDCADLECTKEHLEERQKSAVSGRIYDELFVRHWDTWKDGRLSHLFVVPVAGGQLVDVTASFDADIPSKPFGGAEEITFTPNSKGLVFTARMSTADEPWSTDFDLYFVPADGSRPPTVLTDSNQAWDTQPVFSPDGKTLAYLAMQRPGYESDRFRIVLRDWPEGKTRVLTEDWDRSAGGALFAADGKTIFTTAGDTGEVPLFAIDIASGEIDTLVAGGHVRSPSLADNRIVFGFDHLAAPVDLYSVPTSGGEPTRLTDVNAERLAGVAFGEAEQFSFTGWNGETVYGYVVKPANFDASSRYPVAFLIHGGPQGSFGNDFHYRWNPQTYTGAGYAAVMIDFHGSTGYGQAFTDSIAGDWGGKPLVDLQKGLEAALEKNSWMDGDRVCALGASYGGYMVNWIAGNWSNRFRCLVSHDGIFDNRMMYYATEELWFPEWEHGGTYWSNPEGFERHNPAAHVDKWQTPMLVVQGELDYRVPLTQGLATFTALQRKGIPSRFLYYPNENHWVLRPANSIQWHETVLEWLDKWTIEEAPSDE